MDPLSLGVLLGIYNGAKTPEEIARLLNVDKDSVEEAIRELVERGLVKVEEKKILFFKNKELKLTREGYNTLMAALERVKPQLQKARELIVQGREEEAFALLDAAGLGLFASLLLPLMLGGILALPFLDHEHHSHIHPGEPF